MFLGWSWLMLMLAHVHVRVLQTENSQDMARIHHISLLHMIIGRSICTVLDQPRPLKLGSFGIHMSMAMRLMVLHTRTQRAVVTKTLRV